MKIIEIDYERLFSLGQYENERIGVKVSVDVTENTIKVFKDIKALVLSLHEEGKLLEESKTVAEAEQPKISEKPTLEEINSLKSVEKVSSKGPYQLISKAENPNNPVFDKLRNYIEDRKGFLTLYGCKYWNFDKSSDKIGYRKQ